MYAVLQMSLEPPVTRDVLERAITATRDLARPDCARLVREMFGIVARNLTQADARALRVALQANNVSTEVVDEVVLPAVPQPKHVRALTLSETGFNLLDLSNCESSYQWKEIVFAAGGSLLHLKSIQDQKWEKAFATGYLSAAEFTPVIVSSSHSFEDLPEFRLELFLPVESPRVQWVLTTNSVITVNDAHLRLRDTDRLASLLSLLGKVLSPEQSNLGVKKALAGEVFRYPSLHAFEDEIIWSLYQLAKGPA